MARRSPINTFTSLPPFVLDGGNAWVKYVTGAMEGKFIHAIAELQEPQYHGALTRFGKTAPFDFVEIDGKFYAVGESALNYRATAREKRAKYSRDYYGILFAAAVARAYAAEPQLLNAGLRVMASHASNDYQFADLVRSAVKGRWRFTCGGIKFNFEVLSVETYEEPFGSYALLAFTRTARGWKTPLFGQEVGVIDIGGGTCGVLAVSADGTVQTDKTKSGTMGVNTARESLRLLLESDFKADFERANSISPARLDAALRTGIHKGFGKQIDCREQVNLALNPLVNEVLNLYLGPLEGGANLDLLILTGGGNALLKDIIIKTLGFHNATPADIPDRIQFANVHGARVFDEVLQGVL